MRFSIRYDSFSPRFLRRFPDFCFPLKSHLALISLTDPHTNFNVTRLITLVGFISSFLIMSRFVRYFSFDFPYFSRFHARNLRQTTYQERMQRDASIHATSLGEKTKVRRTLGRSLSLILRSGRVRVDVRHRPERGQLRENCSPRSGNFRMSTTPSRTRTSFFYNAADKERRIRASRFPSETDSRAEGGKYRRANPISEYIIFIRVDIMNGALHCGAIFLLTQDYPERGGGGEDGARANTFSTRCISIIGLGGHCNAPVGTAPPFKPLSSICIPRLHY